MQLALAAMTHRTKARASLRPHKRPSAMPLSPSPTPSKARSSLFFEMPTNDISWLLWIDGNFCLTKMTLHWLFLGKHTGRDLALYYTLHTSWISSWKYGKARLIVVTAHEICGLLWLPRDVWDMNTVLLSIFNISMRPYWYRYWIVIQYWKDIEYWI